MMVFNPGEYDVTPPIHIPEFDAELKYAEGTHNVSPKASMGVLQPDYFTPPSVEQSMNNPNEKINNKAEKSFEKDRAPPKLDKKLPTVKFSSHLKAKSNARKKSLY